jgi:hypothetical protein
VYEVLLHEVENYFGLFDKEIYELMRSDQNLRKEPNFISIAI